MAASEVRIESVAKPGEIRDTTVQSRWSESEVEQLDRLAGRLGLTRSATLRAAIDAVDAATDGRRSPVTVRTVTENRELMMLAMEARRLGVEVRAAGRNLNQIARHINSETAVDGDRYVEVRQAHTYLGTKIEELAEKVARALP